MADGRGRRGQDKDEDKETNVLLKEMKLLSTKMDNIEKQFSSKVDSVYGSLEKMMKAELKKSVKEIRENIDLEIGILKSRLDSLEEKIQTTSSKPSDKFDPDVSIVILGLAYDEGEDLNGKVRELLESGLECEPAPEIAAVLRMRARGPGPGVVKVAFANVEDKVAVLRCKQRLKSNTQFKRVYLRSAKSHTDRILEFNFKTLLQEIPAGKGFYIAGNGRLMKRTYAEAAAAAAVRAGSPAAGGRG